MHTQTRENRVKLTLNRQRRRWIFFFKGPRNRTSIGKRLADDLGGGGGLKKKILGEDTAGVGEFLAHRRRRRRRRLFSCVVSDEPRGSGDPRNVGLVKPGKEKPGNTPAQQNTTVGASVGGAQSENRPRIQCRQVDLNTRTVPTRQKRAKIGTRWNSWSSSFCNEHGTIALKFDEGKPVETWKKIWLEGMSM